VLLVPLKYVILKINGVLKEYCIPKEEEEEEEEGQKLTELVL
jgi:hypothetical protein